MFNFLESFLMYSSQMNHLQYQSLLYIVFVIVLSTTALVSYKTKIIIYLHNFIIIKLVSISFVNLVFRLLYCISLTTAAHYALLKKTWLIFFQNAQVLYDILIERVVLLFLDEPLRVQMKNKLKSVKYDFYVKLFLSVCL